MLYTSPDSTTMSVGVRLVLEEKGTKSKGAAKFASSGGDGLGVQGEHLSN